MNSSRTERLSSKAAMAVSKAFVPQTKIDDLLGTNPKGALTSRIFNFLVLIDDAVATFSVSRSRSEAWLLIIVADFCWQFIRGFGSVTGKDGEWLVRGRPETNDQSDKYIGDSFNDRIKQTVADATWIYDLHSVLRHPMDEREDSIWILQEPTPTEYANRLIRAASGIHHVLRATAARLPCV